MDREEFMMKHNIEKVIESHMNSFDNIKFKCFCTSKTNVAKIREAGTEEKIFEANFSD